MNLSRTARLVFLASLAVAPLSCLFGEDKNDAEGSEAGAWEIRGTYHVTMTLMDDGCGLASTGQGPGGDTLETEFAIEVEGENGPIEIWVNADESLPAQLDGNVIRVNNGQVTMRRDDSYGCSVVQTVSGDMEYRDNGLQGEMSMTIFLQGSGCGDMIADAENRGDSNIPQEGCTTRAQVSGRRTSLDVDRGALPGPGSGGCGCNKDGCCDNDCTDDPDCRNDCECFEDGCCNESCGNDPDCEQGCSCGEDDCCNESCGNDPDCEDCGCGEDDCCNESCGDDPDCSAGCEVGLWNNCGVKQFVWIVANDCDVNDPENQENPCQSHGAVDAGATGGFGTFGDGDVVHIGPCDYDDSSGQSNCRSIRVDVDCSMGDFVIALCTE